MRVTMLAVGWAEAPPTKARAIGWAAIYGDGRTTIWFPGKKMPTRTEVLASDALPVVTEVGVVVLR